MCDKAFDNYPHELEFVPECYKCVLKGLSTKSSTVNLVSEYFMTQKNA